MQKVTRPRFELPSFDRFAAQVQAATSEAGPSESKSSIFAHPHWTIRRRRVLDHSKDVRANLSVEEQFEEAKRRCNPWYRMANSSKRLCVATRQKIPSTFLINLRPTSFPPRPDSSTSGLFLTPDRVLHTRDTPMKHGRGFWVTCHRDMVERLTKPGPHLGLWRLVPGLKVSPRLADQVESQLQIRVLQEVELLRVRLESSTPTVLKRSTSSAHRRGAALRRLTEDELGALSQTGQIAGSSTGTDDIAAFLDIQGIEGESGKAKPEMEFDQNLPSLAIPTFRISELFPTAQHDEVSKALRKVLAVERIEARRAYKHRKRMEEESSASASLPDSEPTKNRSVASNILALSTWPEVSDDGEHKVGEKGLPLAVALWRLRGWYGEGWEEFAIDSRFKRI